MYFGHGWYRPDADAGLWLIAHELAHVLQQHRARGSAEASDGDHRHLDRLASEAANAAIAGQAVAVASSPVVPAVQFQTEAELRGQLAAVEERIKAERVRLADVESAAPTEPTWELGPSGTFERKDWAGIRAGETKTFYNLLERRDVLQLRIAYPDHEFLEQVSINRVVTKDGQVFELPESAIAWQEHQWTLGGTDTEITQQKAVVDGLRASLDQAQTEKTALLGVDARTDEERAGGEPPHPPWAKINKLSTDIAKIREELSSEDRFLKSFQK